MIPASHLIHLIITEDLNRITIRCLGYRGNAGRLGEWSSAGYEDRRNGRLDTLQVAIQAGQTVICCYEEGKWMIKGTTVAAKKPYSREKGESMGRDLVHQLGRAPNACWLFCEPGERMHDLLAGIYATVGTENLVGCTTDGEISSAGFSTGSAVLGGIASHAVKFQVAAVTGIKTDSEGSGRRLGERLPRAARHVQMFSDGLTGNGSALLRGMNRVFGPGVTISGGTAGDARAFAQTWQFIGDKVLTDAAVGISFTGDFQVGTGVRSGWIRAGIPKKVTRASGNVVYQLDDESALAVYRRYLGPLASRLPAVGVQFPFGLVDDSENLGDDPVLRAPMALDEADGSVTFAGEIPEGSTICLCTGGMSDNLLNASAEAARRAVDALSGTFPSMIFFYSCMARKIILGPLAGEETQRVSTAVGRGIPVIGFYTYGEYCPSTNGAECRLHNETATITIVG